MQLQRLIEERRTGIVRSAAADGEDDAELFTGVDLAVAQLAKEFCPRPLGKGTRCAPRGLPLVRPAGADERLCRDIAVCVALHRVKLVASQHIGPDRAAERRRSITTPVTHRHRWCRLQARPRPFEPSAPAFARHQAADVTTGMSPFLAITSVLLATPGVLPDGLEGQKMTRSGPGYLQSGTGFTGAANLVWFSRTRGLSGGHSCE